MKSFEVIDPSNEKDFAVILLGTDKDSDRAVDAAKRAFDGWSNTDPSERLAKVEGYWKSTSAGRRK